MTTGPRSLSVNDPVPGIQDHGLVRQCLSFQPAGNGHELLLVVQVAQVQALAGPIHVAVPLLARPLMVACPLVRPIRRRADALDGLWRGRALLRGYARYDSRCNAGSKLIISGGLIGVEDRGSGWCVSAFA